MSRLGARAQICKHGAEGCVDDNDNSDDTEATAPSPTITIPLGGFLGLIIIFTFLLLALLLWLVVPRVRKHRKSRRDKKLQNVTLDVGSPMHKTTLLEQTYLYHTHTVESSPKAEYWTPQAQVPPFTPPPSFPPPVATTPFRALHYYAAH